MHGSLSALFDTSGFPARWHCGRWSDVLGFVHIVSDIAIFAAYMAIPIVLVFFIRRRPDLPKPFPIVFWMFGAFIVLCGMTHVIEAIIFWQPVYRLAGVVKALTAGVSWLTLAFLLPAVPRALALKSPEQLTRQVAEATAELRRERDAAAQLAEALKAKTVELERSNDELEQFAHVASHDLQEPLRMVVNFMGLLKRSYSASLDETANRYVEFAVDGSERMKQLIDALLAYSRVDARGGSFAPVALQETLDGVLGTLPLLIQESGAQISADPLPVVWGDRLQLEQVFQNLLSNAIKFRGQRAPVIRVSCEDRGSHWELAVQDNGIGFEARHAERIFQMFQRLHERSRYPGSGIGLAIARRIVGRHGGRMWATAVMGEGARLAFTLPKRNARGLDHGQAAE